MSDHPGKLRRVMVGIASRVAALRKARGWSQARFAEELGVTQPTVSRWERGIDEPEDIHIDRMASLAGISPAQFRYGTDTVNGQLTVPVVGYVGAGEEILPVDDHEMGGGLEHVELPPELQDEGLCAVIIRGNSMRPLRDRWRVYYRRDQDGVPPDCIGELCVVKLLDGRLFLKELRRGSEPGTYTLNSWNASVDPIENQRVEWAALVEAVKRP